MVAAKVRQLVISKQANRFILSLPDSLRAKIKNAVERILTGDFDSLDIKKLQPHPHDYRLRVGNVRILFTSDPEKLFLFKAGFRGDVYK